MALLSVVMPCYNAGKYISESINSVIAQKFTDWELVVVDDGSTDNSAQVVNEIALNDSRVRLVSKENGGYVSARLFGLPYTDKSSKYLLFYDADDRLHDEMFQSLINELEKDDEVGAAYCNHKLMDENGIISSESLNMPRFVPTRYWVKKLPESEPLTPFVSILCWTKMIEPMTIIRRNAYEQSRGWDPDFGKGKGNVGDGVLLFTEIALDWKIRYVSTPLFYYRRHTAQSTAVDDSIMLRQAMKVIDKWEKSLPEDRAKRKVVLDAIAFYKSRFAAYRKFGSLKHQLRFHPVKGISFFFQMAGDYFRSIPLVFSIKN